jgi:hypothetical protein
MVAVSHSINIKLAADMLCHVPADYSGLVFFSTKDFSTSCVQFDLSSLIDCRSADGKFIIDQFVLASAGDPSLNELRKQLLEHCFVTESA